MYWLHAITPTHVGTGTGAGFIDLPIMREKTTGWPLIPGSAIKGVRRDHFEQQEIENKDAPIRLAFARLTTVTQIRGPTPARSFLRTLACCACP
jgi:CRISPR type III-B/RAMP module RAMP protein Cmr4